MAKPRIFVSSTYYDLKQVRADLERFIKDLGYESILNERGNIAYGNLERLEAYCYKEVGLCDIVIAIIGGRFGTESKDESYCSITQKEIKTALKNNKQVYIFVEKNVLAEFQTYLINKNIEGITYKYVDSIKIYDFIETIQGLPNNNTLHGFDTANDIISFLKEQWAGLFQRFLQEQTRIKEINKIEELEKTAETLNQLVEFLTKEKRDGSQTIIDILMSNHPAMEELRILLDVKYRVYFTNYEELNLWLNARGFEEAIDFFGNYDGYNIWERRKGKRIQTLQIIQSIFDENNKLKVYTKEQWEDSYIKIETIEDSQNEAGIDDGMPF